MFLTIFGQFVDKGLTQKLDSWNHLDLARVYVFPHAGTAQCANTLVSSNGLNLWGRPCETGEPFIHGRLEALVETACSDILYRSAVTTSPIEARVMCWWSVDMTVFSRMPVVFVLSERWRYIGEESSGSGKSHLLSNVSVTFQGVIRATPYCKHLLPVLKSSPMSHNKVV